MAKKLEKIKTKRFRKVFRIILWLMMLLIIARGITSFLKKDQSSSLKALIAENAKAQDNKRIDELGTNSFAENFTRAFIEFNGDPETYKNNLSKYASSQFKTSINTARTAVINVTAVRNDWIGNNKVLVDCFVRFMTDSNQTVVVTATSATPKATPTKNKSVSPSPSTSDSQSTQDTQNSTQNNVKEVYLRVPVSIKDGGKYIVESSPTFVANDSRSDQQDTSQMDGTRVEKPEIREIAETFLKSYCEDNSTSISYYMADNNSKIKGLDGSFAFKNIDTFELKQNGDKYNADIAYYVEGSAGKYIQEMQIVFIYKNNRYLIEKLNTVIK